MSTRFSVIHTGLFGLRRLEVWGGPNRTRSTRKTRPVRRPFISQGSINAFTSQVLFSFATATWISHLVLFDCAILPTLDSKDVFRVLHVVSQWPCGSTVGNSPKCSLRRCCLPSLKSYHDSSRCFTRPPIGFTTDPGLRGRRVREP